MPKDSHLIQFYEINVCQLMIFRLYTVYSKHEKIKVSNKIIRAFEIISLKKHIPYAVLLNKCLSNHDL